MGEYDGAQESSDVESSGVEAGAADWALASNARKSSVTVLF